MLSVLTERSEIKKAIQRLTKVLAAGSRHACKIVSRGENKKRRVHWHPRERYWSWVGKSSDGRMHVCKFGVEDASRRKNLAMTVQFIMPIRGSAMLPAGRFVSDDRGRVYLAHSGNVAPGMKGGGRNNFRSRYKRYGKCRKVTIDWPGGKKRWLILVTRLDHPRAVARIGLFIRKVAKIKILMKRWEARSWKKNHA